MRKNQENGTQLSHFCARISGGPIYIILLGLDAVQRYVEDTDLYDRLTVHIYACNKMPQTIS